MNIARSLTVLVLVPAVVSSALALNALGAEGAIGGAPAVSTDAGIAAQPAPELEAAAKKALQTLAEAYGAKRRAVFLRLVSQDFSGDLSALEDALGRDFRNCRTVGLVLTPDKVEVQGDSASVEFHYDLTAVSDQGASGKLSGRSNFVFRRENGEAKLYKIEEPTFFGKSLAPADHAAAAGPGAPPSLAEAAKKTLQDLAEAYSAKRRAAFMRLLSGDFSGDLSTLEDALVKDFRSYRSVNLDLIPDKVEVQGDAASVEFHYNLTVVSDLGASNKFSGRSSYAFRQEDGKLRLYKMEKPILFGNSLPPAENPVASGQRSLSAAESTVPGKQDTIRGSASLTPATVSVPGSGFRFETQSNVPETSADIFKSGGNIGANRDLGCAIVSIGACGLDSVTAAPSTITGGFAAARAGECFAVLTSSGKYAVLRVTSTGSLASPSLDFDYKFQPSGSTSL